MDVRQNERLRGARRECTAFDFSLAGVANRAAVADQLDTLLSACLCHEGDRKVGF